MAFARSRTASQFVDKGSGFCFSVPRRLTCSASSAHSLRFAADHSFNSISLLVVQVPYSSLCRPSGHRVAQDGSSIDSRARAPYFLGVLFGSSDVTDPMKNMGLGTVECCLVMS